MNKRSAFSTLLYAAAMSAAPIFATPLAAQTLTNSFGGLSQSSKDPIDIESDVLVVHDQQKYATFTGNVKAVQGTTTLRARQLDVHYIGGGEALAGGQPTPASTAGAAPGAKPAAGAGAQAGSQTQINKIEAKGDVIITSGQDQTTTSDWALYDVPAQLVTVGGNVVLTQGQNVLKGDRLVIDLKTGESRFENPGTTTAGGRIRALFVPKEADDAKAKGKSGDAESAAAASGTSAAATSGAATPDANSDANSPPAGDDGAAAPQANEPAAQDDKPWSIVPGVAQ